MKKFGSWCAKHPLGAIVVFWFMLINAVTAGNIAFASIIDRSFAKGVVAAVIWVALILVAVEMLKQMMEAVGRVAFKEGFVKGRNVGRLDIDRRMSIIVQALGMRSDALPILERVKAALVQATGWFCAEVYGDEEEYEPLAERLGEEPAERVMGVTKAVWTRAVKPDQTPEYTLSDDIRNTTDKFLDAIDIYHDERKGLYRFKQDTNGTCSVCGTVVAGDFDDPITRSLKNENMMFFERDGKMICLSCLMERIGKLRERNGDVETSSNVTEGALENVCKVKELTLDEAIKHCEDVARSEDTPCAKNHRQLACWLTELQRLRAANEEAFKEATL